MPKGSHNMPKGTHQHLPKGDPSHTLEHQHPGLTDEAVVEGHDLIEHAEEDAHLDDMGTTKMHQATPKTQSKMEEVKKQSKAQKQGMSK